LLSGCSNLTSLTIGSNVTIIHNFAFRNCTALKEITSKATTPPACSSYTFDENHYANCIVYVPIGCQALYQSANQWKDFKNFAEGDPTSISQVNTADRREAQSYDLQGRRLNVQPQHGIIIKNKRKSINQVSVLLGL
jgi:hypothetical protein